MLRESNLNNEFILLEILNNEIGVFKYKLINGELIIEKGTITKWWLYLHTKLIVYFHILVIDLTNLSLIILIVLLTSENLGLTAYPLAFPRKSSIVFYRN